MPASWHAGPPSVKRRLGDGRRLADSSLGEQLGAFAAEGPEQCGVPDKIVAAAAGGAAAAFLAQSTAQLRDHVRRGGGALVCEFGGPERNEARQIAEAVVGAGVDRAGTGAVLGAWPGE